MFVIALMNTETRKRTLAAGVMVVALGLVVAAAALFASGIEAQRPAECDNYSGTFNQRPPSALHSQRHDGDITLTWRGPGLRTTDLHANCTWRTQDDYLESREYEYRSQTVHYTVERRTESTEYTTVATFQHSYSSEGLTVQQEQRWTDTNPPNGRLTYRVQATKGTQQTPRASIVLQVGPVVEVSSDAPETPAEPGPPATVLCFYQWDGQVSSMALTECTSEALQANWTRPLPNPDDGIELGIDQPER